MYKQEKNKYFSSLKLVWGNVAYWSWQYYMNFRKTENALQILPPRILWWSLTPLVSDQEQDSLLPDNFKRGINNETRKCSLKVHSKLSYKVSLYLYIQRRKWRSTNLLIRIWTFFIPREKGTFQYQQTQPNTNSRLIYNPTHIRFVQWSFGDKLSIRTAQCFLNLR